MKRRNEIRERVGQYRVRMRGMGYRQINLWVPDTRSPAFAKECRRQSLLAGKSDRGEGIQDFLDHALNQIEGWEP